MYVSTAISVATMATNRYVPPGRNELQTLFERHFADFCDLHDAKYAAGSNPYIGSQGAVERVAEL